MSEYTFADGVDLDLDDIWEYIAADNINAADRWIEKLFDAFELLAKTPGGEHTREDLTSFDVRFWPVGAYLIVYRVQERFIEIVAVTQGSRDIPSFLRQRLP